MPAIYRRTDKKDVLPQINDPDRMGVVPKAAQDRLMQVVNAGIY